MITPYDSREALPAWDLFDNDMIRLSIMTAKDKYDEAKKDQKEFLDKYGNFYSPLEQDMAWYKENVTDKFQNTIDDLYARGIDPLRSPEGRAAIRQAMNSVDVGTINAMKQNAITAQEYLKNKAQLEASGKYDPNLEENYLGYNISNWSTVKNGIWDRLSPTEAMSLKQLTESSFNNRTPHDLTQQDVESFGMKYDPNARYKGFTYNDLLDIANTTAPGLTGTVYADYFRDMAKQKLIQNGIKNPTQQQINMQLAYDIADQQHEYMIRPEADYTDHYKQESLRLQKIRNNIMAMRARAAAEKNRQDNVGWTKRQKTASMLTFKNNSENVIKNNPTVGSLYGLTQSTPIGSDKTTALALAAGISNPEQISVGSNQKRFPVMFGSNDLMITGKRQYEYYDKYAGELRKDKLGMIPQQRTGEYIKRVNQDNFNNYLKRNHVSGYIPSTDVTVNYTVDGDDDIYDINSYARVNKSDITGYFNNSEKLISQGEDMGLVAVTKDGRRVEVSGKNKGQLKWDNIDYIDIPITRSIKSIGYGNSTIDTFHDSMNLGKSIGSKREPVYQQDDFDDFE